VALRRRLPKHGGAVRREQGPVSPALGAEVGIHQGRHLPLLALDNTYVGIVHLRFIL
jgi:hypothetical protein